MTSPCAPAPDLPAVEGRTDAAADRLLPGASAPSAAGLAETALYPPVKAFLQRQGFTVKGEVCGCDVVALREDTPSRVVVAELKLAFSLELLLQGMERTTVADEVWLAVRAPRRGRRRDGGIVRLCRALGFGLLAVHFPDGLVEELASPAPYVPRRNARRRRALLREHRERLGDPCAGGTARAPLMTAFRQRALACAGALAEGARPLAELRALVPQAGAILQRNVYGWFEREARGRYRLSQAGHQALARHADRPDG